MWNSLLPLSSGWGINSELLSSNDVHQLLPWLRVDDLEGGLLVRDDALVDAENVIRALVEAAKNEGEVFHRLMYSTKALF